MSEEEKNKIAIDLAKQGIDLEDVEKICLDLVKWRICRERNGRI